MTTKTDRVAGVPVRGKEGEKVLVTGSGTESAVLEENWRFLGGLRFRERVQEFEVPRSRVWG